jgi:UDP-N-acetylglucosamine 2-epimerase (non-hydrolysing)
LRNNTERPSTIDIGSNVLVPYTVKELQHYMDAIVSGQFKKGQIPPLWDGKSTERIAEVMLSILS